MLHTLKNPFWKEIGLPEEQQPVATAALEEGKVLYLPELAFELSPAEKELLTPRILKAGSKNISFNTQDRKLKGAATLTQDATCLTSMMARFARFGRQVIENICPAYMPYLLEGRTSFRPIEVVGRKISLLKDDTRLHIDAFSATPNYGKRIVRIFSNVNPVGRERVWHIGEPFENVVEYFLPKLRRPFIGSRRLLALLNVTKSYRSLYDHYMLMLHNGMKKNHAYQNQVKKCVLRFPPGSTWIAMTDSVSHAALSGQFVLEHTFYLPTQYMLNVEHSPLFILERALGQKLIGGSERIQ